MKLTTFSSLFYVLNSCGLAYGVYLVLTSSLYRILVLYCLFNILLLWAVETPTFKSRSNRARLIDAMDSGKVPISLAASVMVVLFVLVASNYGRMYVRSSFMPPLIAAALVIVGFLALASSRPNAKSFFTSSRFLLPAMISISLFVNFSIYLVQPNPFARPLFATVDAYRDFANAVGIVKLSGFQPENMVMAPGWYAEVPVIPILVSFLSIAGSLSIQESQIILTMILEILGVVGVWLLSTAVVRKIEPALASSAGVLTIIFVWLQPNFFDPASYIAPLRLSIPLLVLVVYLLYKGMLSVQSFSPPLFVSLLIIAMALPLMHAIAGLVAVVTCLTVGLLAPNRYSRHVGITMVLIAFVIFANYVLSGGAFTYAALLDPLQKLYPALERILSPGHAIISSATESKAVAYSTSSGQLLSFIEALPLALLLSICTLCITQSARSLRTNLQTRGLNSIHLAFAVLAIAAVGLGYISGFLGVDSRYFTFPQTPLAVVACALLLALVVRSVKTSRMRGLVLIAIVVIYVFCMTSSPHVLYENSQNLARLIPTESESAAADFVSAHMQTGAESQILSDWPFYNYVMAVTYSHNIGNEQQTNIVDLMFNNPSRDPETFVILRQFYLQTPFLETTSPRTGFLTNVTLWNSPTYNKIYDSSTTWIYFGAFEPEMDA